MNLPDQAREWVDDYAGLDRILCCTARRFCVVDTRPVWAALRGYFTGDRRELPAAAWAEATGRIMRYALGGGASLHLCFDSRPDWGHHPALAFAFHQLPQPFSLATHPLHFGIIQGSRVHLGMIY